MIAEHRELIRRNIAATRAILNTIEEITGEDSALAMKRMPRFEVCLLGLLTLLLEDPPWAELTDNALMSASSFVRGLEAAREALTDRINDLKAVVDSTATRDSADKPPTA